MLLNPSFIALLLTSAITASMVLYSAWFGLAILRKWDLKSGSSVQLRLERRTYLITTVLSYAFGFELLSLFLLVHTAESVHGQLVGAMCAAGVFNANPYGNPALIAKTTVFLLSGIWLSINHLDSKSPYYPLIRVKYGLLLAIAPFYAISGALLWVFALNLRPDVITSCCGAMFTTATSAESVLASAPSYVEYLFYPSLAFAIAQSAYTSFRGRGGKALFAASLVSLAVSTYGLIYYVSPYYYELPTHMCPFCLLKGEYHFMGYALYGGILGGALSGMCSGVISFLKKDIEGASIMQRRLALLSFALTLLFAVLVILKIATTDYVRV